MLCPFAHSVVCCYALFGVVAQSLKPVKLLSQQLPTFLCSVIAEAQQCWIPVHSSSNIAHYISYGLYPAHDALQVPTLSGVIASFCTPLPTGTQQFLTLLATLLARLRTYL